MKLDNRIKVLDRHSFRSQIHCDDIKSGYGDEVNVYYKNDSLDSDIVFSEKALVFLDNPIVVPTMNYLYATKIYKAKSDILDRLVRDLMFLNPNISDFGISKMAQWIVSFFVATDDENKKMVSYEELLPYVSAYCKIYEGGDVPIIEKDRVVLYKKTSLLSGDDKKKFSRQYRTMKMSKLYGELIHQGAMLASESMPKYANITKSCVLKHTKNVSSIITLNKHIFQKTVDFLEDIYVEGNLNTEQTLGKFDRFIDVYSRDKSLNDYVKELNISKSTAVLFKKLHNKYIKK